MKLIVQRIIAGKDRGKCAVFSVTGTQLTDGFHESQSSLMCREVEKSIDFLRSILPPARLAA